MKIKNLKMLCVFLIAFFGIAIKAYATDVEIKIYTETVENNKGTGKYEEKTTTPKTDDYKYNTEKSSCTNGAKITYNESTYKYTISASKKDSCNLYFSYVSKSSEGGSSNASSGNNSSTGNNSTGESNGSETSNNGSVGNNGSNSSSSKPGSNQTSNNKPVENPKTGVVIPVTIGALILVGIISYIIAKKHTKMFKID